ncbi:MAG: hypothetical protein LBS63_03535 [Prevotellaceae bacterium]|jgi:hypothetical protein|nr:hypothetical protein [Prevotellaceae bacterium]
MAQWSERGAKQISRVPIGADTLRSQCKNQCAGRGTRKALRVGKKLKTPNTMKRFFVAAAATLMAATTFIACSDDNEGEGSAPESLVGTKWVAPALTIGNQTQKRSFSFTTATEFVVELSIEGQYSASFSFDGTYVYAKPTVTFTVDMGEGEATHTGTISGNKLVTKGDDGEVIELTLQEQTNAEKGKVAGQGYCDCLLKAGEDEAKADKCDKEFVDAAKMPNFVKGEQDESKMNEYEKAFVQALMSCIQ